MQIIVKLYGNLKQHMPDKKEIASVEIPPGTTIAGLLARLGVSDNDVWMSALNDSVVSESTELHDGDVLEVFEPVGGGQGKSMP